MKVKVHTAQATFYPDVMASSDKAGRQREQALLAPSRVVEVPSESTAAFDRGAKLATSRQPPSLQEHLLVDLDRRHLEAFRRESEGWVLHEPAAIADAPTAPWLASV